MSEENRSRQLIALIVFLVIGGIIVYSIYTGVLTIAVVKGRSMLPLLREGDIVFIVKTRPENIHVGDVIVYQEPSGSLVVHRVIKIFIEAGKYYYVTLGDNNPGPDIYYGGRIPFDKVVGKVVEINDYIVKIPCIGGLALKIRS